jgi:hypothetical protein
MAVISLLTDFAASDAFVGTIKGVILAINPQATLVDVCHEVPAHDIEAGAFMLGCSYGYFPEGTIHLAVVDPGVGSGRRPIAAAAGGHIFVAPDNGLLSHVLQEQPLDRAVRISQERYRLPDVSRTFHARDIFAPAAAHLSLGVPLEELGPPATDLVRLPLPEPVELGEGMEAHVIYIDRFGNATTDLSEKRFEQWRGRLGVSEVEIAAGQRTIHGPVESYSGVLPGEPLAIFGSSGRLEIAVNMGNAASALGLRRGDVILLRAYPKTRSATGMSF